MAKFRSTALAPVVLMLACCGCDYGWRLDACLSENLRDHELREWLQDSRVEFWSLSRRDGVPEWAVREPDGFGEIEQEGRAEDPPRFPPVFDGPIVRSVKWSEESGIRTAEFRNCHVMWRVFGSPAACSPIFRVVPAAGDDKVLFLGRNGEGEAVWVVAEKVPSRSPLRSLNPEGGRFETLSNWGGSYRYCLTGPRFLTSMRLSYELDKKGRRVLFHVQIPHPDVRDKNVKDSP